MRHALPYAAFFGALFFALGVFLPFWPLFLQHNGLTGAQIGTLLAMGTWVKVAGNPCFGRLADTVSRGRLLLAAMTGIAFLGSLGFHVAQNYWSLLALYVIVFPVFQALIPLGDARALAYASEKGLAYGRLRLWGSLAFLGAVIGMGQVLKRTSPEIIPWFLALAFLLLFAAALVLPKPARQPVRRPERGLTKLLKNKRFLVFVAVCALLQASHAVYYAFSSVHWTAAGFDPDTIGWLWAEGVLAEIALFAFGERLVARIGPKGLLAIAAVSGLLRWSVLATTTALLPLGFVQLLHAGTFGAAHLGAMHFIARYAPTGLQNSAQGLYTAAVGGIGMGLAMFAAGPLYDNIQGYAFAVMAAMSCLAGALLFRLPVPRTYEP